MSRCCQWCYTILDTKVPRPQLVLSSIGCRDANAMFHVMFSDEEINRRDHYLELTKGK